MRIVVCAAIIFHGPDFQYWKTFPYAEDGPAAKFDFQEPYLRHIFGFIGLTDVTFIHAENQVGERAAQSFVGAAEEIALEMA
jgi:FMN-dependent NADH-azoreductase